MSCAWGLNDMGNNFFLTDSSSTSSIAICGVSEEVAESWIVLGSTEDEIAIPIGGNIVRRVMFQIPLGSPLCIARYKLEVQAGGSAYATDFFDVKILAK